MSVKPQMKYTDDTMVEEVASALKRQLKKNLENGSTCQEVSIMLSEKEICKYTGREGVFDTLMEAYAEMFKEQGNLEVRLHKVVSVWAIEVIACAKFEYPTSFTTIDALLESAPE